MSLLDQDEAAASSQAPSRKGMASDGRSFLFGRNPSQREDMEGEESEALLGQPEGVPDELVSGNEKSFPELNAPR